MDDLAVIVVSHDQERWLPRCLSTLLEHAQGLSLDLVVVDNGATGAARELVERDFPQARAIASENRGFAHACNLAAATCDAPWLLFLNPDTEVLEGSLAELVGRIAARDRDRRRPPARRQRRAHPHDAPVPLGVESRSATRSAWSGSRAVPTGSASASCGSSATTTSSRATGRSARSCSSGARRSTRSAASTSGSSSTRRRSTSACGCGRAGWKVVHSPAVTILHHGNSDRPADARLQTQLAWAQLQYADKNLSAVSRPVFRGALLLRYGLRSLHGEPRRRGAARAATALLLGRRPPPFESRRPAPPPVERLAPGLEPGVIGATGGSGTRVLAAIVQRGGMFVGSDLNRSLDALDFAAFFDRWVGRELAPGGGRRAARARRAPARGGRRPALGLEGAAQRLPAAASSPQSCPACASCTSSATAATWRSPRTRCSCASTATRCSARRTSRRRCARSRSGARSTCARPTSASASSATATCASASRISAPSRQRAWRRCSASSGSRATPSGSPPAEVQAPPTLGRWREADPELQAALTERAADALERFGYQSSSE